MRLGSKHTASFSNHKDYIEIFYFPDLLLKIITEI